MTIIEMTNFSFRSIHWNEERIDIIILLRQK